MMDDDLKWAFIAAGFALLDALICYVAHLSLFSQSVSSALGGWLVTFALTLAFLVFYRFKKKPQKKQKDEDLLSTTNLDQILQTLKRINSKAFKEQTHTLALQTLRLQHKTEQLDEALHHYFKNAPLSYAKFSNSIQNGLNLFEQNSETILKRIQIFDEVGYEVLLKKHLEYSKEAKPYQESFLAIKKSLQLNEEILNRLDRLLIEVNALSSPSQDSECLPALEELSQLIDQTKLYKKQ